MIEYKEIIKANGFDIHIEGVKHSTDPSRYYYAYVVNDFLYTNGDYINMIDERGVITFNTLEEVKAVVQKFIDSMK